MTGFARIGIALWWLSRARSAVIMLVMSAVVAGVGIFVAVYVVLLVAVFVRFRRPRVVRCPESREFVVVEAESPYSPRRARVYTCSHWPERAGCAQTCVRAAAPAAGVSLAEAPTS